MQLAPSKAFFFGRHNFSICKAFLSRMPGNFFHQERHERETSMELPRAAQA
jgi:hypothetical protein